MPSNALFLLIIGHSGHYPHLKRLDLIVLEMRYNICVEIHLYIYVLKKSGKVRKSEIRRSCRNIILFGLNIILIKLIYKSFLNLKKEPSSSDFIT